MNLIAELIYKNQACHASIIKEPQIVASHYQNNVFHSCSESLFQNVRQKSITQSGCETQIPKLKNQCVARHGGTHL